MRAKTWTVHREPYTVGSDFLIMKHKHKTDEDIPDFLQQLKEKGDGFSLPESYFEDMEDAVFARLKASGDLDRPKISVAKRQGLFPLFIRPRTAMALAAALALILAAVWFFRQADAGLEETQIASVELTEDDIESYVLDNVHEFDPEQLAALTTEEASESTLENVPATTKQSNRSVEELHPDDLDQILDEMTDEELEQIL